MTYVTFRGLGRTRVLGCGLLKSACLNNVKAFLSGRIKKLPKTWTTEGWVRPLPPKELTQLRRSYGFRLKPWADLLFQPEGHIQAWERGTETPPSSASLLFQLLQTKSGPRILKAIEGLHG